MIWVFGIQKRIIVSNFYKWRLDAYIKISAKILVNPYHQELNMEKYGWVPWDLP